MDRPDYLDSYRFSWETFDIIVGGKSSLDAKNYLGPFRDKDEAGKFLKGYGFDVSDPVQSAELFGNFQEALQFIKRYFLLDGNPDGLDLSIPNIFYSITDVSELMMIAAGKSELKTTVEDSLWASIVLKVMHTILHTDKDLRYRYFSTIQTQIFDRFYRYLHRDDENNLFLKDDSGLLIPLLEFETKAKKTRESIIIKLLHKEENVAEELFDRIGIRFVTKTKVDILRVLRFLHHHYIIMPNNIKPSRSQNTLVDLGKFRKQYYQHLKLAMKNNWNEEKFASELETIAESCLLGVSNATDNVHTSSEYHAIHFTNRQLIKYRNPFLKEFNEARKMAKDFPEDNELAQKILNLDTTSIARDVRFFYPYEVQITDEKSHLQNTKGEASHQEYKKSQLVSAMNRLFKPLVEYYSTIQG
jgi:uncharacterized protein (TIGR04562 family)